MIYILQHCSALQCIISNIQSEAKDFLYITYVLEEKGHEQVFESLRLSTWTVQGCHGQTGNKDELKRTHTCTRPPYI